MSEDDRMDRARRIREMREGSRSDDADDGEETNERASTDPGDAEDAGSGSARGTGRHSGETGSPDGPDGTDDAGGADTAETDAVDTANADDTDDEDEEGGMHIPGAEVGDVEVDVAEMARQAGLESAEGEDADAGTETETDEAGGAAAGGLAGVEAGAGDAAAGSEVTMRVLEFTLGDESYCLDIEYIEEIVEQETITRVPNTPDHVEGVVDLRGQITTILDPKGPLHIENGGKDENGNGNGNGDGDENGDGTKDLLVVFDPAEFDDQGAIGWVVDDVTQVMPLAEDDINKPPIDEEHVNGVVDRDGEFVIWTTPKVGLERAGE